MKILGVVLALAGVAMVYLGITGKTLKEVVTSE
jgi:cell division protein FtsB